MTIPFVDAGSGKLVVILDGGQSGMPHLQDALAENCRVVRIDLSRIEATSGDSENEDPGDRVGMVSRTIREIAGGQYVLVGAHDTSGAAIRQTLDAPADVEGLVLVSPTFILPAGESPVAVNGSQLAPRLREIECHTLVVLGQKDRAIPPEAARVYKEMIPNCTVSLVYDAAHDVMADRPEALIDVVADFVERGEAFIVGRQSGVVNP
jgi:pimeloyl-ACP methyl ester carboxylesterase